LGARGGVKFPTTFVSSTDANTLDDYQEVNWTPTMGATLGSQGTISTSSIIFYTGPVTPAAGDTASGTYTISSNAIETFGKATKVGNRVSFSVGMKIATLSVAPAAGSAIIFGLPWKPSADQSCNVYIAGLGGADAYIGSPQGSCRNDSALVSVNMFKNKTHINNIAELFQVGAVIFVSGTYHTDATN